MKLGIVIPWRPRPSRIYAFDFIYEHYSKSFPEAKIYLSDKEGDVWNMSGSRNIGCDMAFSDGCDVALVSDADIYIKKDRILQACESSLEKDLVSIPYQKVVFLEDFHSKEFIKDTDKFFEKNDRYLFKVYSKQVGGAYAITPKVFSQLNGWDERFVGWGFEDLAFRHAHGGLTGFDYIRIPGPAVWLHHEDRDKTSENKNANLFDEYLKMSKDELSNWVKGNRT
jgi:predicted glycosyltransferase involved in capsule biosynthesis